MTDLGVQHSALTHASAELDQIFNDLSKAGVQLDERAHAYLGSGWQGQSADAYRTGYDEWADGRREVWAALAQIGELINEANQRFVASDESAEGSMVSLHGRLGALPGSTGSSGAGRA